jgi:NodT family efflux transporter outer membrane factor (OMF) lipoprotein
MLILRFLPVLLLLISACAPHSKQTVEPKKLPDNFSVTDKSIQVRPDQWWTNFNDPNLNQLLSQLFRSNLSLAQGHARLSQAEALMRQARSFRYPSLSIEGQTGSSSQARIGRDSQGESSQLSLSAGFELDLFGKLASRDAAGLLNYQASGMDLQSLYMSLSAQLADLYYFAIEQRAQLALTDSTISSFSGTLQRVESRYRQGVAAAVDLYQARQNLAAARANRLNNEQTIIVSENALAVLLGDYPGSQTFLQQARIPAAPPQLPAGLPAELLTNRPDIHAAFLRVEAKDAEVAAAIADRFPSFNLIGSYGGSRSNVTGSLISGDFWSLLLKLSQPVFDGGRRKAEVARKQAQFAEVVAGYQQTVLRSFQEVEDALSGNRTTSAKIIHLREQEKATAATQRLSLDRYLNGLSDYLPVLTSQISYFTAQSRLLAAQRQLLSQRISLARALGGSWMAAQLKSDHQQLAEQGNAK